MTAPEESTSAALRRIEAELGDARTRIDQLIAQRDQASDNGQAWCDEARRHLAEVKRLEALVIDRSVERDDARAELASARQELDRLRNQPTEGA